jgi:YidC/Oxa1 family membrane protein insertase
MSGLLGAPMGAAYHIVTVLALVLTPIAGGLATATAIVAFTAAVRLLLLPLSYYSLRGQASMSALLPKVQELQQRYARQPDRLQRELAALYRQEGGGMLSGCLPLLLQLPFFSIMYLLFLSHTVDGRPNGLLRRDLLGTPLGSHWLSGAGPLSGQGVVFLGLFALLAVVASLAARAPRQGAAISPTGQSGAAGQGSALGRNGAVGKNGGTGAVGKDGGIGQAGGALAALGRVLPYSILVIAAVVPLAAGLYLLTTTTWTVAERAVLRRRMLPRRRPDPGPAVA